MAKGVHDSARGASVPVFGSVSKIFLDKSLYSMCVNMRSCPFLTFAFVRIYMSVCLSSMYNIMWQLAGIPTPSWLCVCVDLVA